MSAKREPPLHLSDQVHVPKKRKKFKPRFRRTKQEMEEGLTVEEAKEARSLANPDMSDDDDESSSDDEDSSDEDMHRYEDSDEDSSKKK